MYKINLVIADFDEKYVDKLMEYIKLVHPKHFHVSSFTRADFLLDHLASNNDRIDILLAHPGFLLEGICLPMEKVKMVIGLTDGAVTYQQDNYPSIYKYQPGHNLVNRLIQIFTDTNGQVAVCTGGDAGCKVITVYSPVGGVGKTSVTLGIAGQLAERGKAVFVLSLEAISSVNAVMQGTPNTHGISHVLLNLATAPKGLPLKLDACTLMDQRSKVFFWGPADWYGDVQELKHDELQLLISTLRELGKYDYILIDTDSVPDERVNVSLTVSDVIIYVQTFEAMCRYKSDIFMDQARKSGLLEDVGFMEKAVLVFNKCRPNFNQVDELYGLKAEHYLPKIRSLWYRDEDCYEFDALRTFAASLATLARTLD